VLCSCGGGGGSSSPVPQPEPKPSQSPAPTPQPAPSVTPTPSPSDVSISGTVNYDYIPHFSNGGLNYNAVEERPVRGATVQLLDSGSSVVSSTKTDEAGHYSFSVSQNTSYRIRVKAEYLRSTFPGWQVRITDNTQGNSEYALDGSLSSSGDVDSTRDLVATSGWNGSGYGSSSRAAAPFAILDSVYQELNALLDAGLNKNLPSTEIRWSTKNRANPGSTADGDINSSHFTPDENNIYLLGDADNDTDEFDRSVVQHEFAHFLEHAVSRSESEGGDHGISDKLDMRVVFSEGFANATTALVSGTGYYEDSGGTGQAYGFRFSLEDKVTNIQGFYSEASVGQLIYDVADPANEASDPLDMGLSTVYGVLASSDYINSDAMTSVYLFLNTLRSVSDAPTVGQIDNYAASIGIHGSDEWGSGETNGGSVSGVLPVYADLNIGQSTNVCSNDSEGQYNGVDVRRFLKVDISQSRSYGLQILASTQGTGDSNPNAVLWHRGKVVKVFNSGVVNQEIGSVSLSGGTYVLEVYDYDNVDGSGGVACFDVSLN